MPRSVDDHETIGPVFDAQYKGVCALNRVHKVRLGDKVSRIQRRDNPMLPVGGVACPKCVRLLPRGKQ